MALQSNLLKKAMSSVPVSDTNFASHLGDIAKGLMKRGTSAFDNPYADNSSSVNKPEKSTESDILSVPAQSGNIAKGLDAIVDKDLIAKYGLTINSGYRDAKKNASVGGAKNSQHLKGNAYDLNVSHLPLAKRRSLIQELQARGIGGIGVGFNSIHADIGDKRYWSYDKNGKSISGMMEGYGDLFGL